MACEAGLLGIPYVYMNPLQVGYINQQCEDNPYMILKSTIIEDIKRHINKCCGSNRIESKNTQANIEQNTINVTEFLTWFIEDYPESKNIMKENPNYQYRFK